VHRDKTAADPASCAPYVYLKPVSRLSLPRGVPVPLPFIFGTAFMAAEFIKQRFLIVTGYTESGQNTAAIVRFSPVVAGLYILFGVFILV